MTENDSWRIEHILFEMKLLILACGLMCGLAIGNCSQNNDQRAKLDQIISRLAQPAATQAKE